MSFGKVFPLRRQPQHSAFVHRQRAPGCRCVTSAWRTCCCRFLSCWLSRGQPALQPAPTGHRVGWLLGAALSCLPVGARAMAGRARPPRASGQRLSLAWPLTSRDRTLLGSSSSRVKMSPRLTVSWDPSSNSTCKGAQLSGAVPQHHGPTPSLPRSHHPRWPLLGKVPDNRSPLPT